MMDAEKNDRCARYENKMRRAAAIVDWIRGHKVTVIVILAVALFAILISMWVQGLVVRPLRMTQDQYVYGETPEWSAKALFRLYYPEYAAADSGEWSLQVPILPGDYQARLVTFNVFDREKRTDPISFTILQRPIDVTVSDAPLPFGEKPAAAADTVWGDRLDSYDVAYDDLTKEKTGVHVDAARVHITDEKGNDVTDRYILSTPTARVTFVPKDIYVTSHDAVFEYDAAPHSHGEYTQKTELAFPGHFLQLAEATEITAPGELANALGFRIVDAENNDYTANYTVHVDAGKLTVTNRKLTVVMDDVSFVYDGEKHQSDVFTFGDGTTPAPGQSVSVSGKAAAATAGAYRNEAVVTVQSDVTEEDVTGYYDITVRGGTLTVEKRPVHIIVSDDEKTYDGNGKNDASWSVSEDTPLVAGDSAYIEAYPDVKNVGSYENKIVFGFDNGQGNVVTENYAVTYSYGTLTIVPRPITLYTKSAEKTYDGTPLSHEGYWLDENTPVVDGESVLTSDFPQVTKCGEGEVDNIPVVTIRNAKEILTQNYDITVVPGTLRVLPRSVSIGLPYVSKEYDGTPLTSSDFIITAGSLPDDHGMTVEAGGSRIEIGRSNRTFGGVYTVLNGQGEDVSDCFTVTCDSCEELEVTPRFIEGKFANFTKEYDGRPLYAAPYYSIVSGSLLPGHKMVVNTTDSLTSIGAYAYRLSGIRFTDEKTGADVSRYYSFSYYPGILQVTPVYLAVASQNVTQYYIEGEELRDGYFWIAGGHLLPGHKLICEVDGVLSEIGTTVNHIRSVSVIETGTRRDVTYLYDVELRHGRLTFLLPE